MERREMDEILENKGLDSYRGRLDIQVKLCGIHSKTAILDSISFHTSRFAKSCTSVDWL
jgi:hypothetical protein